MTKKKFTVKVEGLDEAVKKLVKAGEFTEAALEIAVRAGAEVIRSEADRGAPEQGAVVQDLAPAKEQRRGRVSVDIGPSAEKWYLRFFETGVQPFEINMMTRRTTRTGGGGRRVYGDKEALAFDVGGVHVVTKVVHRGPMAAKPFLRPAIDGQKDKAADALGASLKKRVFDPLGVE